MEQQKQPLLDGAEHREKSDKQALLDAAKYLDEKGWIQGAAGGCGKPACLFGAVVEAIGDPNPIGAFTPQARRLFTALEVVLDETNIIVWNDTEGRTKQEVIDALLQTAESLSDENGSTP